SSTSVSTSRMRGTFSITTGPETRSDAARSGSASFLLPLGSTDPVIGKPPSTMKRSPAADGVTPGSPARSGGGRRRLEAPDLAEVGAERYRAADRIGDLGPDRAVVVRAPGSLDGVAR